MNIQIWESDPFHPRYIIKQHQIINHSRLSIESNMPFTSGIIATIEDDVGNLADHYEEWEEHDFELQASIEFDHQIIDLRDNVIAKRATAAEQTLERVSQPSIENNGIDITEERKPVWNWTTLWVVQDAEPQDFVVVKNSDGIFAFDRLEDALSTELSQARFDLESIIDDFPGQWVGGFEERQARVQSGMLYGDDIERDSDMGRPFMNSPKSMIGPIVDYRGDRLKLKIGQDGFVQVVAPGDYSREAYLNFIEDVMLEYLI